MMRRERGAALDEIIARATKYAPRRPRAAMRSLPAQVASFFEEGCD